MTSGLSATKALEISVNAKKPLMEYAEKYLVKLYKFINNRAKEGLTVFEVAVNGIFMENELSDKMHKEIDKILVKETNNSLLDSNYIRQNLIKSAEVKYKLFLNMVVDDLVEHKYKAHYWYEDNHWVLRVSWEPEEETEVNKDELNNESDDEPPPFFERLVRTY